MPDGIRHTMRPATGFLRLVAASTTIGQTPQPDAHKRRLRMPRHVYCIEPSQCSCCYRPTFELRGRRFAAVPLE